MWQKIRDGWILILVSVLISLLIFYNSNSVTPNGEISSVRYDLSELQKKASDLQSQISLMSLENFFANKEVALLSPSQEGFEVVTTSFGKFLISLSKIEKYADGYKATFEIGNIHSMNISNVGMEVSWNKTRAESEDVEEWNNSFKKTKVTILDPIYPNTWKIKSVVLTPAAEEETQMIRVKLDTSTATVSMRR